ncbi:hypothetical protein V2J09_021370 [Rumex salicifolius]
MPWHCVGHLKYMSFYHLYCKSKVARGYRDAILYSRTGPARPSRYIDESFQTKTIATQTSRTPFASEIDDIISAEIRHIIKYPEPHKLVTEHMVHGPCRIENMKSPCMINRECSKNFPKPFYTEMTVDQEGFPVYRRRNNGVTVTKDRTKLDNRYIVSYNMYLLMKYRAHINVEWCNQSRAIKYLFKYIRKGSDKATTMIKIHLDCCYLSSCEAVWRIYGFDIHSCVPPVIKHPLHLRESNMVMVRESQNFALVLRREGVNESMFIAWFTLNEVDTRARDSTYVEIPLRRGNAEK